MLSSYRISERELKIGRMKNKLQESRTFPKIRFEFMKRRDKIRNGKKGIWDQGKEERERRKGAQGLIVRPLPSS